MSVDDEQYQAIVEICQKSQKILDERIEEIGLKAALVESKPYESMWQGYSKRITKPVELRNADFSGLLFKNASLEKHNFIDCDFSRSRWFLSFMYDSNCADSNFQGFIGAFFPFRNTNCTNCNFIDAEINWFNPFERNKFKNSNFTNAKLDTCHSFLKGKKLAASRSRRFQNATMDGCRLIIKEEKLPENNMAKEELKAVLESFFSPEQLAVMRVEYEGRQTEENGSSNCFIATAACGINSHEVITLRRFRDTILANSALGRLFVRVYYRTSPPIALLFERSPKTQYVIRNLLIRPFAKLANRKISVKDSQFQSMVKSKRRTI